MVEVVVNAFGGVEALEVVSVADVEPGVGEVAVRVTSIGMNHAELMGRRGEYKLSTGDPPFVLGLEAGGVVEALGDGVSEAWRGRRVCLRPEATRLDQGAARVAGTYRSRVVCAVEQWVGVDVPASVLPDAQLGTLWLSHFTAWGALCWKLSRLGGSLAGRSVAISAASSAVGLAAAQVVRAHGGRAIGLTSSAGKVEALSGAYDAMVLTGGTPGSGLSFRRELKKLTDGRGVDVAFTPVAAGPYVQQLVLGLADHGVVMLYGLLGVSDGPGALDLTPLIRKHASVVGYVNYEVFEDSREATDAGIEHVLGGFGRGVYAQRVAETFGLSAVREAHGVMEAGGHVGKLVLVP